MSHACTTKLDSSLLLGNHESSTLLVSSYTQLNSQLVDPPIGAPTWNSCCILIVSTHPWKVCLSLSLSVCLSVSVSVSVCLSLRLSLCLSSRLLHLRTVFAALGNVRNANVFRQGAVAFRLAAVTESSGPPFGSKWVRLQSRWKTRNEPIVGDILSSL